MLIKKSSMKRLRFYLLGGVCLFILCFFSKQQLVSAETQTNSDAYKEFCATEKVANHKVITLQLDDKLMTGYQLYFCSSSQGLKSGDTISEYINTGVYVPVTESEKFPGSYIWSGDFDKSGTFHIYEKGKTDVLDYINSFWNSDLTFDDNNSCIRTYYTISFAQGNAEAIELPQSYIAPVHRFYMNFESEIPYTAPSCYEYNHNLCAPGYIFSHWEDENNVKLSGDYVLSKPTTFHPVFVNEDAKTEDNSWEEEGSSDNGSTVKVQNAEELLTAVHDKKSQMIIISGNIQITSSVVENWCKANDVHCSSYELYYAKGVTVVSSSFYNNNADDVIIIKNGAHLQFEGVSLRGSVNWEMRGTRFTVQDGGELSFVNNTSYEYMNVAIQPKATLTVDCSSNVDFNYLYNYGKVQFTGKTSSEDVKLSSENTYFGISNVNQHLINGTTGVIDIAYGGLELRQEYERCDWQRERVNNLTDVTLRNYGKIRTSGYGKFSIEGSSSTYQHDRGYQIPLVNYGDISIESTKFLDTNLYAMNLTYGRIWNYGNITIVSNPEEVGYPWDGEYYLGGSSCCRIYQSEFVNHGNVKIEVKKGAGLGCEGMFFEPEKCSLSEKSTDVDIPAQLRNEKDGTVKVVTSANTVGCVFTYNGICDNKGNMTLEFAGEDASYNTSLALYQTYGKTDVAVFVNDGTVVNNGYIACNTDVSFAKVFTGNEYTGTGKNGKYLYKKKADIETTSTVSVGTTFEVGNAMYKVTNASDKTPQVCFVKSTSKTITKLTIPSSVEYYGTAYKVTEIAASGCKNLKKVTTITIPSSVKTIGNNAFTGCSKLKKIVIKSTGLTEKTIKAKAFSGIGTKVTIQVPKAKHKSYLSLFRKKGLSKKVKVKS